MMTVHENQHYWVYLFQASLIPLDSTNLNYRAADGWNNLNDYGGLQRCTNAKIESSMRLFSLAPLAPRSILVSMSISTLKPIVISSTCLSRAATV
ncbi:hypothetical protein BASA61_004407 [Batrachochytrium salamandrivorans]|nr:hypothetical protein BASA61_004407 [Batrachochytrium salamandrivorans]